MNASNWGALYYRDVYGLDVTKEGALFVSMFYILFTTSRLISGFLIEKIGYYVSFFSSLGIAVVIYLVGFLCGVNGRWIIPFTGFFIGIMFPTYMCLLMQIFGDDSSRISSIVIFISGAANGLIQLLIGYINEYIGNAWGFRCNVIYTLIPLVLLFFVRLHEKKLAKKRQKTQVELPEVTNKSSKVTTNSTAAESTVVKVDIPKENSQPEVAESSSQHVDVEPSSQPVATVTSSQPVAAVAPSQTVEIEPSSQLVVPETSSQNVVVESTSN